MRMAKVKQLHKGDEIKVKIAQKECTMQINAIEITGKVVTIQDCDGNVVTCLAREIS